MSAFGDLLRSYRHQSRDPQSGRPLTQERLAELLSIESGLEGYSGGTVSNWERGANQIRRDDRHVLVGLVKTLYQTGGIKIAAEAQQLLLSGNYRPLDQMELSQINPAWQHTLTSIAGEGAFPSASEQEADLPSPSYSRLFGVTETVDQILTLLATPQSPYLLMIVGLGGIGKTAVADAVARQAIQQMAFAQVVWLTVENLPQDKDQKLQGHSILTSVINALAEKILPDSSHNANPQRLLARVRNKLKNARYLVIIDNLEDPDSLNQLLTQLQTFTVPSKFLITSRRYPAPDSEVYTLALTELAQTDAIEMLKYQAETSGTGVFQQVTDEDLLAVYGLVGGHPLALRLIPRLVRIYPLSQVMGGWETGEPDYINQIYQSIYDAFWNTLGSEEKQLLVAMPVAAQVGLTSEHVQSVSGLAGKAFWPALTKLVDLCLIEPRGSLQTRRYGIHSLTAQYLQALGDQDSDSRSLAEMIHAHITYWRQYLDQLPENQWQTVDGERSNIWQAVQFSLDLPNGKITPVLRESWQHLSESLFRFVELRGYASEWQPFLEDLCMQFEEDTQAKVKLLLRLGELCRLTYQFPEAVKTQQNALLLATRIADKLQIARAHYYLGLGYYHSQMYDLADEQGQLALNQFQEIGYRERESAAALNLLGTIAFEQKQFERSAGYLNQAAAIWRSGDHAPELARTLNNLARTWQAQQKTKDAFSCYTEAAQMLADTAGELDRALIYLSEGTLHFELGQFSKAEQSFKRIDLSYLAEAGHLLYQALTLNNLGQAALKQGEFGKADVFFRNSIEIWRRIDNPIELANALSGLGDVYKAQNNRGMARTVFEEVVSLIGAYPNDNRAQHLNQEAKHTLKELRE